MTSGTSQLPSAGRPVLQRWLTDAPDTHPVRVLEAKTETNPAVPMGLDALEMMAAALDDTAADNPRWSRKIAEFGQLTSMGQLLEMRAEFALALALTDAGIGYELGNTKIVNPDLLLLTGSGAICAGVEVTARAPQNINELVERVEAVSGGRFDVDLAFDGYPSRLQPEIADKAAAAVRAQVDALGAGSPAMAEVIQVEDPKNGGPLEITVQVCPGNGAVGWEVTAGVLDGPLGAAEYAAFEAGRGTQKAAQGRSLDGAPVLLAVDVSRYGAAWMRPGTVWAQRLAAAEQFTPDYPFAGIAAMRQSLEQPGLLDIGVGLSPHLPAADRQVLEDLCAALDWPCA
ncbi:hypothetical protein [Streptomyces sp. NBC_00989]|uniref:hypothetical protein n=1 Tax=Streptomyces sp. NBC_00989 TaxID=2903705 RepID=UPI0038653DE5|nr:hypothetical protein OG714_00015 [Streptomyces sp. NBC_00989]WSW98164.1 hypothetical protein OG714_54125 [Streptomyces sp. NBC_00989]